MSVNATLGPPGPIHRAAKWPAVIAKIALSLTALVLAVQCQSGNCDEGDYCECRDGNQCFLQCAGDGCVQNCHHLDVCGSVCEDDCDLSCHDVQECTASCGDDCIADCHHTNSCSAICGKNCDYTCHDVSRCGVAVGDGSRVDCHDISSCIVECDGDCSVRCVNAGGNNCRITCRGGSDATDCGAGLFACGPC